MGDDGDQESKVPAQRIKQVPKATGYAVGDRVLGAYLGPRGGHGQWYPGTISAGPGPGNTYSIAYDDGDLEDNIPLARIKKLQGDAGEKQEMQITTVIMVQGADGKMQMKKIKANLGDINLSDQKAMARKLEALIKGEDLNAESDIREEVPDQVQDDPKRSTIVRLAATY